MLCAFGRAAYLGWNLHGGGHGGRPPDHEVGEEGDPDDAADKRDEEEPPT